MNTILIKSLAAVGLAGSLGLGAAAFAQANGPSTPPPTPPAATAPAEGHAHTGPGAQARAERRSFRRQAMRHRQLRRLAHALKLDKTQRTAVRQLHARAMADIWAARADPSLTKDQRRQRVQSALENGRTGFRNLLTPDQRAKLDQIESRREGRMMGF
jgi:hypothetical protein